MATVILSEQALTSLRRRVRQAQVLEREIADLQESLLVKMEIYQSLRQSLTTLVAQDTKLDIAEGSYQLDLDRGHVQVPDVPETPPEMTIKSAQRHSEK